MGDMFLQVCMFLYRVVSKSDMQREKKGVDGGGGLLKSNKKYLLHSSF